ncbi:MAG: M28 family peptidase [Bacteroidia bacterium]
MLKHILCLLFSFFIIIPLHSQIIEKDQQVLPYARKIVDTMASESMYGRGYINKGDSIAANYIKNNFKKLGLKSFDQHYDQHYDQYFKFPINTFPFPISFQLTACKKKKSSVLFEGVVGENMLISAASNAVKGNYTVLIFDSIDAASEKALISFKKNIKKAANTFIMVDDRAVTDKTKLAYFKKVKTNYFNVAGIIDFNIKLTWGQSETVADYSVITILTSAVDIDFKALKQLRCKVNIQNKFIPQYQSQNVIGYVKGTVHPDSFIVFSAHYDHLGKLGTSIYFPGANDNASGCAMLLSLARYYRLHPPSYSIAFMAFGAEEVGLVGSSYYTEHPLFPLNKIRFLLNMDIMGTGEEGITVVNGSVYKTEFDTLKQINLKNNFIKDVKIRGKAANSDHYYFSEKSVKAFFIYTMGGIKAYHDIYDKAETLPLNEFENIFKLITKFATYLQN